VYTGLDTATVIAFGLTDAISGLFDELMPLLPDRFYCHFFDTYRETLREQYSEEAMGTHIKMNLIDFKPDERRDASIVPLTESDEAELRNLYTAAYPGCYFTSRILQTGKYFGCRVDDLLVAVAGVHVYSPEYKTAALGSIATHPDHRGKGLASQVTSQLVNELKREVDLICLNVKADNAPAIHCYEKLGFVKTHEYEESLFELKK
jgi:ribosomal protein S18 acetylase RimI-like enzyme